MTPEGRPARAAGSGSPPARDACPYLRSDEGWRGVTAHRDHRCYAVSPAVRLAADKQGRLCLAPAHHECATYLAALAARAELGLASGPSSLRRSAPDGAERPIARTLPTIVRPARSRGGVLERLRTGPIGQGSLLLLVILAVVAFGLAQTEDRPASTASPDPAASAATGPTPSPGTPSSTPTVAPTPTLEPIPTPTPSPVPTVRPTATPVPTIAPTERPTLVPGTYVLHTIAPGETLSTIAATYGTTVATIAEANGITDPGLIYAGQVLVIPNP